MSRRELHVTVTANGERAKLAVFVGAHTVATLTPEEARTFARMLARLADRIEPPGAPMD